MVNGVVDNCEDDGVGDDDDDVMRALFGIWPTMDGSGCCNKSPEMS